MLTDEFLVGGDVGHVAGEAFGAYRLFGLERRRTARDVPRALRPGLAGEVTERVDPRLVRLQRPVYQQVVVQPHAGGPALHEQRDHGTGPAQVVEERRYRVPREGDTGMHLGEEALLVGILQLAVPLSRRSRP